jgi:hypothetical protein
MQYTIRNVPKGIDEALRRRAKEEGRSLNEVVVDVLSNGLHQSGIQRVYRDLSWIFEAEPLGDDVIQAIEEMDRILPEEYREVWGMEPPIEAGKKTG